MNETLDCTNCCISDFKHSLCDCHGDFCTKYKSIGDENDFMQAVLADRPQGEWMSPTTDSYIAANFYKCSICGKIVNLLQMRSYKYCPNCGARMVSK